MERWKTVFFSPKFKYPMLAMVILVAVSTWYYRLSVRRSETAVNERSLRVLAALAEEFSNRLANFEYIGLRAWDPSELRDQVPDLEQEGKKCDAIQAAPRRLTYRDDKLQLLTPVDQRVPQMCRWSIPFDRLMAPLEGSLPKGVFEDLLLADASGRILYQTRHSGMTIADLHPFFEEPEQGESKTSEKPKDPLPSLLWSLQHLGEDKLATQLATSRLTDVSLGGEQYKLYTAPVPVPVRPASSVPPTAPAAMPPPKGDPAPLRFFVGGILHERAYQAERVMPLRNTLVTIGFFVLLGVVGIYPFLRFRWMGQAEMLKQSTGFVYVLQMVFTAILVGGLAGHLMFSHYVDQTDDELRRLAGKVEQNLERETRDALKMLDTLETFYVANHRPVGVSALAGKTCWDADLKFERPAGKYEWTPKILNLIGKPDQYPYFDNAYFANRAGYQEAKFSARSSVTPEVRVCGSGEFTHVLASDLWQFRKEPHLAPFWIEPMYSITSGRYLAFIGRRSSDDLQKKAQVAVIGTPLISVSQPVFPPDYGFAIMDRAGKVLFHSTPAKNGRENFVDACGRSRQLRDLIETGEGEILETSYLGIRHRVLIWPITAFEHCSWSVAIFRDLTNSDEDHFDSNLLFIFLLGGYIVFLLGSYIIFLVFGGWRAWSARRPASWIWPTEKDCPVYWRIFCVLILVFILNLCLLLCCDGTQLWVTAYAIPLLAVIFTVLRLTSNERGICSWSAAVLLVMTAWNLLHVASVPFWLLSTGICAAFACLALPLGWLSPKTQWRPATAYALPATVLLLTIGWIPPLRLFNASVLFQRVVAARRSQLELADQLKERQERIRQAYFGSDGSEEPARAFFLRQRLYQETKDLYLDTFPSAKRPRPHRLEPLLSSISSAIPDYYGNSPRRGLGLPGPGAVREWCEDGPFLDEQGSKYSLLMLRIVIRPGERACDHPNGGLAGDYHNSWIASILPQRVLPRLELTDPWILFQSVLMWAMVVGAFFALRYTIGCLFALNWKHPEVWPEIEISPGLDFGNPRFGRHTVLLGTPHSGKTEALKHCSGIHYIDLIDTPQWEAEHLAPGSDEVFVLDHFDHDLDSLSRAQRKLRMLERLVYQIKCRVVIVTTVDPLYYFDWLARRTGGSGNQNGDNLDIGRWANVLASFHVVRAKNRSSIEGERYFPLLWETCSDEEHRALYQIAKYGWVNYHQKQALTHLFRCGILSHGPKFEVADPDFAKYIRHSVSVEDLAVPEEGGKAETMSALRIVLVVAGIGFIAALAYVGGDQIAAYVATGASAVTAASRAFAKPKGPGGTGAEGAAA